MAKRKPTVEVNVPELEKIVDATETGPLNADDRQQLKKALHTLAELAFPERNSEKLTDIAGIKKKTKPPSEPAPGHGRYKADDYEGADREQVPHRYLQSGSDCPDPYCRGKVYLLNPDKPGGVSKKVRIIAVPPLQGTVYECQNLRCQDCGKVYTAPTPEGVGEEKFDDSVAAMVAVFRYGMGVPFNRLEGLQGYFKVPLPASTQWELVDDAAEIVKPLYVEMGNQAAQADVVGTDDTGARILQVQRAPQDKRTGLHTTGVVARSAEGERPIALYHSGTKHAGENLLALLTKRSTDLAAPVLMGDALSWNTSKLSQSMCELVANCLAHGRRKFVEEYSNCPDACLHVLNELGLVYLHDEEARSQRMSAQERLKHHQAKSAPVMKRLHQWMAEQFDSKTIEPNSGLGKAIKYMQNHWNELTLFLRQPGAPLDNNSVERALKKAVLHRKNSLFYKTLHGAEVGDIFMSLIHTCELNKINPFDYLVTVLRHALEIRTAPALWMPWNYREQLVPAPD